MNTVQNIKGLSAQVQAGALPWASVYAVTAAILVGTLIIAAAGFAGPEVVHNAAHDLRHGLAFPCH